MAHDLESCLLQLLKRAVEEYQMFASNDRVLLCFSGGKDSFGLFKLLHSALMHKPPLLPQIFLYPVFIDLGFRSPDREEKINQAKGYLLHYGYTLQREATEIIHSALLPNNKKNPCFICASMRRKRLYEIAHRLDCSKIAMAHHKDDIIETLLLNIFFSREISTMLPKQEAFGGQFYIVRPLAYIEERLLRQYAWKNSFPVIANPCVEQGKSKRRFIKNLLESLEKEVTGIKHNIFQSTKNVKAEFLMGSQRAR